MCPVNHMRVFDSNGAGEYDLGFTDGKLTSMEKVEMDVIPAEVFSV